MSDPWLTIIGVGEDGLAGLSLASQAALAAAEIVFGASRHLELVAAGARGRAFPVPFSVEPVLAARGQRVVMLASGDPFWFGAGGSIAAHLGAGEWVAHPALSTFGWAAARMGWRLEEVLCLGLHAAPLQRLRPVLARGVRAICLVRDAAAAGELAAYLTAEGFGASHLFGLEALGGPREMRWNCVAQDYDRNATFAPLAVAVEVAGAPGMSRGSGLPDDLFDHDGQITKRPVRALTLSALAPRPGEVLWDIGTGSGSVAIEFLLAAPGTQAHALEADPVRAARAEANAAQFGLGHRFHLRVNKAPEGLADLPPPDVVFIGGGASEAVLQAVWTALPVGARLVANAVTLESEALLMHWSAKKGGHLLRIDLAEAQPLGGKRGWKAAYPVVQWSVQR